LGTVKGHHPSYIACMSSCSCEGMKGAELYTWQWRS